MRKSRGGVTYDEECARAGYVNYQTFCLLRRREAEREARAQQSESRLAQHRVKQREAQLKVQGGGSEFRPVPKPNF